MIQFIYFDLGNVLVHFSHDQSASQMARVAGIDEATVKRIVFDSDLQIQYERGRLSTEEFYKAFCEATQTEPAQDQLIDAASDIFWTNRAIVPVVCALRVADMPVGILSNTCEAHWQWITKNDFNVVRGINTCCLSFQVGSVKPEPEIYHAAIGLAGCPANQIFYVDDRPENVHGAVDCGIDAVHFQSVDQLVRDLRQRGVGFNY